MDPLADVLGAVKLSGAIVFRAELRAPWSYAVPHTRDVGCRAGVAGVSPRIQFHVVADGECVVRVDDQEWRVGRGGVILLPDGRAHLMSSGEGTPTVPVVSKLAQIPAGGFVRMVHDGAGPRTTILCGYLGCEEPIFDPLLSGLPSAIVQQWDEGQAGAWLQAMVDYTIDLDPTAMPAGGAVIQTRLVELMLVEVLRRHVAGLPDGHRGWLAGLRDPHVARAVARLQAEPSRHWTVATLARAVGLSRSILAERFARLIGQSPMQYLAAWRLQLASSILRRGDVSIAEAAARVGYQSEAAFHRAFKRVVGQTPATWRRRARDSQTALPA